MLFTLGYTNSFVARNFLPVSLASSQCRRVDVAAALGGMFQIVRLASVALAGFSCRGDDMMLM